MKPRTVAIILGIVLVFYILVAGGYGYAFISTGEPIAIALGLGLIILPLIGLWVVYREFQFGWNVEKMANVLESEGGLREDDLVRTSGGKIDRDGADAEFEATKLEVEADPEDWRSWFRLGASYDDAGDRKRARGAMRYAWDLYSKGN